MRSARIKQWIITDHLTQQVVADRIGYWRSSVSRALACEHVSSDFWARFSEAFPERWLSCCLISRTNRRRMERLNADEPVIAQMFYIGKSAQPRLPNTRPTLLWCLHT